LKKRIATIVVMVVIAGIIYLTLQSPEQTGALTKMTQQQLLKIGIDVGLKPLRHYVHYMLYFILGLSACNLCTARGWNLCKGMIGSLAIGVMDECLKISFPTREFDFGDLMRDFAGISIAILLMVLVRKIKAVK